MKQPPEVSGSRSLFMRLMMTGMFCVAIAGCGDAPSAPTPVLQHPQMVGGWTGTFTSNVTLPDGSTRANVCVQEWTITSQAGAAFSGTFTLSGGTPAACSQIGTISGMVLPGGRLTGLFASETSPQLSCRVVGYTWLSGSVSGTSLRGEWSEQLACDAGPVSRTLVVEMTKR